MMSSNLESLSYEFSSRQPEMLADLETLVRIESPTHDKRALDRAQDYLTERLVWAGADVRREPRSAAGDHLVASWPGEAGTGGKQVLIIGHVDTVWPIGELERQPARVEDGYFYGPGAFDMKAGLVITLHAMKALRDLGHSLKRDVALIINTDEEIGSLSSRELIEAEARRSHCALIMEPALFDGWVTIARKGVGRFRIHVRGRAAHAGRNPREGVNAIEELARQVIYLQSLSDFERGNTVNVGVVNGGTRPNVVPAEARAEVDLRVVDADDGNKLVDMILGLSSYNPETVVAVEGGLTRPPWARNAACDALFRRACAVGRALGMPLEGGISGGGSDGNLTAALEVPTLDGLGPEGAGAHAVGERVRIDSIPQRAALLAGLLLDLGCTGE